MKQPSINQNAKRHIYSFISSSSWTIYLPEQNQQANNILLLKNNLIRMKKCCVIIGLLVIEVFNVMAQKKATGTICGIIIEQSSGKPLEFATVAILKKNDSTLVQNTTTNIKGQFEFNGLSDNQYKIIYSFIGFEKKTTSDLLINANQRKINLGKLYLSETAHNLKEVEISAWKSTFVNKIDRKIFNVGEDLMSKTGSVSDLLQNVPSLQVDIDGNVNLRGSDNVTILINGKPSALMGANRAAVLQQMPANTIERIEIITNPSAKFKPDGTSGIINLVLKKNKSLGFNGSISANMGNDNRFNGNIFANYNPGKLNIFGSYGIRQDDRLRYTSDKRTITNLADSTKFYSSLEKNDYSRPLSHIINAGIDYKLNDHNKIGVSANYNFRSFIRKETDVNTSSNDELLLIKDYDRLRKDPENEKDLEFSASLQHVFDKEGHELDVDYTTSVSSEQEDNHYNNIYRLPAISSTFDNTLIKQGGNESQLSIDYSNPLSENSKFEAGYNFELQKNDMNFFGENYNSANNTWAEDFAKTNHFIYNENIHVLFATYEQDLGKFGFLAGLRAEEAFVNSNQVTNDTTIKNNYFRLYPTLHLSYKLSDIHELQLNYSHRIHRPEGDDMNPFPEYQDPYNLRIGNPHLEPEDIHSIELGYQIKKNKTTFLSTAYYHYSYNGMTDITKYINDSVLLTTKVNLSKSYSAGLEFILSSSIGKVVNFNLSTNLFYNTIDASSLGYSKNKGIVAWSANLSSGFNITNSTVLQLTSNYVSEKLTPQGKRLPSFVVNIGLKQEFLKGKAAFIFTASDLFNSLRNNSIIDTPELYRKVIGRRSARILYLGLTYSLGSQNKKQKENSLKFDNQM